MFSKMILPLLGGTPQVWNTAMVFFQVLLLAGYAYAHCTTKFLSIKVQAILHLILLIICFFILPIAIPDGQMPPLDKAPTKWQLSLMTITVGGPFFIISASAPMLQRWFSYSNHKDAENPYFLYAASNLGSMSALFLYPTIIEPLLDLKQQSYSWMFGYVLLLGLIIICVLSIWNTGTKKSNFKIINNKEIITWSRRGKWLLMAFIPSSLLLGVTTYITTDIASAPLLWIIPLLLYIGTFVIAFARKVVISEKKASEYFGYLLIYILIYSIYSGGKGILFILLHMMLFFLAALICHSILSNTKPSTANLTEFYLTISFGGALGGIFNAIIAPSIFVVPIEYALALGVAVCMRFSNIKNEPTRPIYIFLGLLAVLATIGVNNVDSSWIKIMLLFVLLASLGIINNTRWAFGISAAIIMFFSVPTNFIKLLDRNTIHQERNFFGISRVINSKENQRLFVHGTTIHGAQSLKKNEELVPTSYYSRLGPIGDLFRLADQGKSNQKVAVLGLGVGTTACYYKNGRSFDFFEINPEVINIAKNPEYFTFLSSCGSPYEIIEGDARIELFKKEDENYDFILADAYSSDNIPIHLITREAIELYMKKLKPNGILGFHISNSYIDIEPVLTEIANSFSIKGYSKFVIEQTIEETNLKSEATQAFVFAMNRKQEEFLKVNGWKLSRKRKGVGLWTDKFSNILTVLGNISNNQLIGQRKKMNNE